MLATSDVLFLVAGLSLLLAVWLPRLANGRAFSPPMVFVGLGLALGALPLNLPEIGIPSGAARVWTEHVTEVVVILALFGVGLAIDRPFTWRGWRSTWRLLGLAMPLCIAAVAVAAWGIAGLVPASALLLGAALAPTDPVLASEVQVGAPSRKESSEEDEVRFALTSEAGLNDGLAFPFVYAAILMASVGGTSWVPGWLAWEVFGKVALGVVVGLAVGTALARLAFAREARTLRFAETSEALVALAGVFLAYGMTEVVGGYGFLAVFVAALALRSYERQHEYHGVLHEFVDQLERLLTLAVLLALGYAVADGLLAALTWGAVVVGLLLLVVLRPALGWVSLAGMGLDPAERLAVAFFGVRGIGSLYYVAYAAGHATFPDHDLLWATIGFTVLCSVVLHGVSAGPVMDWVDHRREIRTGTGHRPDQARD